MKTALFFFFLIFNISVFAHDAGNVIGTVSDAKSGTPLVGAVIQIKGSLIATASDINGKFEMKNIQIGHYELVCSLIGYKPVNQIIVVKENETDRLIFKLEESMVNLNEITIQDSRPVSAASSQEIRAIDMQLKPFRSSQDMLLMVPGLFIAQHQGGGKAEQIFLRGFDCDHGTDVSLQVDGMPVNMVSHAHGQGFAGISVIRQQGFSGSLRFRQMSDRPANEILLLL